MSESALVKSCLTWLGYKKIFCYRQNSGAYKTPTGGFVRFGAPGAPDIVAVIGGKYVGLECKSEKGRQSPAQKQFQEALERAGGEYWVIRSLADLAEVIIPKIPAEVFSAFRRRKTICG